MKDNFKGSGHSHQCTGEKDRWKAQQPAKQIPISTSPVGKARQYSLIFWTELKKQPYLLWGHTLYREPANRTMIFKPSRCLREPANPRTYLFPRAFVTDKELEVQRSGW